MIVYGLKNCDTCRKALAWLAAEGIPHRFHDVRKDGLSAEELARWLQAIDRSLLINRRGTTYRGLDAAAKAVLEGDDPAPLLLTEPAVIKRPIFSHAGEYIVGFGDAEKAAIKAWGC